MPCRTSGWAGAKPRAFRPGWITELFLGYPTGKIKDFTQQLAVHNVRLAHGQPSQLTLTESQVQASRRYQSYVFARIEQASEYLTPMPENV